MEDITDKIAYINNNGIDFVDIPEDTKRRIKIKDEYLIELVHDYKNALFMYWGTESEYHRGRLDVLEGLVHKYSPTTYNILHKLRDTHE